MSDYRTQHLLLPSFPAEDLVRKYAEHEGWVFAGRTVEDPEEGTVREVMWMVEQSLIAHYAEDAMTETAYVMASSASPEKAERLSIKLAEELPVVTLQQLLRAVREAAGVPEISRALIRLTLGAPRLYDVDVFTHICDALRKDDADIRLAAIWAIGFMPWPEYKPVLKKLRRTDPDQMVRQAAADMLEAYSLGEDA